MPNFYFNYTYSPNLKVAGDLEVDGKLTGPGGNTDVNMFYGLSIGGTNSISFDVPGGTPFSINSPNGNALVFDGPNYSFNKVEYIKLDGNTANGAMDVSVLLEGNAVGNLGINYTLQTLNNIKIGPNANYTPIAGSSFMGTNTNWNITIGGVKSVTANLNGLMVWDGSTYVTNTSTSNTRQIHIGYLSP